MELSRSLLSFPLTNTVKQSLSISDPSFSQLDFPSIHTRLARSLILKLSRQYVQRPLSGTLDYTVKMQLSPRFFVLASLAIAAVSALPAHQDGGDVFSFESKNEQVNDESNGVGLHINNNIGPSKTIQHVDATSSAKLHQAASQETKVAGGKFDDLGDLNRSGGLPAFMSSLNIRGGEQPEMQKADNGTVQGHKAQGASNKTHPSHEAGFPGAQKQETKALRTWFAEYVKENKQGSKINWVPLIDVIKDTKVKAELKQMVTGNGTDTGKGSGTGKGIGNSTVPLTTTDSSPTTSASDSSASSADPADASLSSSSSIASTTQSSSADAERRGAAQPTSAPAVFSKKSDVNNIRDLTGIRPLEDIVGRDLHRGSKPRFV